MKPKFKSLFSLLVVTLAILLSGCSQMEVFVEDLTEKSTNETIVETTLDKNTETNDEVMPDLKIDPDRWHDDQVREKQKSGVVKQKNPDQKRSILKDRDYYSLEDVAAYIHQYHQLPNNYITKAEAEQRNWTTNDERFVIGGDRFGNREGKLPKAKGRYYYEADIQAGYSHHRGPERIVFSNDGLIYYTNDHYETFDQLYGKEVSE